MTSERVTALCRDVASTGLRSVAPFSCPEDLWPGVLERIQTDRLAGLALESMRRGELLATSPQRDHVRTVHERTMRWCLRLESRLGAVHAALRTAGIPALVLKGASLAHLDYEDASLRVFRDLDILVPSDALEAALGAAASIGFRPMQREPRPGFQSRFGKGRSTTDDRGVEIDLHRTLAAGPYGVLLPMDSVWGSAEPFRIGGLDLRAPDRTWRFVHACLHAVITGRGDRLWILRDVAQLHNDPRLDPESVRRLAADARAEPVVALAIQTVRRGLGVGGPMEEWAAARAASRREVRLIRVYEPGRSEGARALATLRMMPGVSDRLRLVRSLLVPEGDFLAGRHMSRRAWVARGMRSLWRRGHG